MTYQREIHIETRSHGEMHDLTDEVARIVGESKVRNGIAHVFNIGSTDAIGTIEFEPGLETDLPEMLDKLFRQIGITVTNAPGTTATAIRICRQRCSVHRSRFQSTTASCGWALGNRFFIWNVMSNPAGERLRSL